MYGIEGLWCLPIMGFDNSSHFVVQTRDTDGVRYVFPNSSLLLLNTWTQIGTTYSSVNGLRLYVNGSIVNTVSLNQAYIASGEINAITIGTCLSPGTCATGVTQVSPSQFHGKIDELKVYSRELDSGEIAGIANP